MSDWGPWENYVKKIKGNPYNYRKRGRRVPGRRWPEQQWEYLGRTDGGGRSVAVQIAIALVGDRDEYDRPHPSLLNAAKEKAAQRTASSKGAAGGKNEPTATGSNTASQSSSGSEDQAAPEQSAPSETK